jgi:hypothetical protein
LHSIIVSVISDSQKCTGCDMDNNASTNAGTAPAPVISGPELLPSRKRSRVWTPEKGGSEMNWEKRIEDDVNFAKGKIGMAALGIKTDKLVNMGASIVDFLNHTFKEVIERQANTFSDFAMQFNKVREENVRLNQELAKVKEDVCATKLSKEKVEVKASAKEMEEKVKVASTQFKVMDLDLGKEFADRKAMTEAAKKALQDKVRSDLKKDYDAKIRSATVRILAKDTYKRNVDGKDIWTAPVLVSIQDKESRWGVEDVLRKSNVFPSFHWPKEMLDNIKAYRTTVSGMGFSDKDNYVRIRPDERDGAWKIRADVKPKTGNNTRFSTVASFDIPPLDDSLKAQMPKWASPTWVKQGLAKRAEPTLAEELTGEDLVMHF